jgi:hypothetical protein
MAKAKKLITTDLGRTLKQPTKQPVKPCSDCPWRRDALPGWLGSSTAEEWVHCAHSESPMHCHVFPQFHCAGAAIYRSNTGKLLRDAKAFKLPVDKKLVFDSPYQFLEYHTNIEEQMESYFTADDFD